MGLTISSLFQQFLGKKQMRILMVGLDAAGQSTKRSINRDENILIF